jgi:hypothetical protein
MKKTIFLSIIIGFTAALVSVYALAADAFPDLVITKATITPSVLVKQKLTNLLKSDNHVATANDYLKNTVKLIPGDAKENYWGMDISAQNAKSKKTLVCSVLMQDFVKKGTKDIGLLAQVTVTTQDKKVEVYTFLLSCPGSKIENCKEFYVDPVRFTKVLPNTKGWLTSVWENLVAKCKTCSKSLGTCTLTTFTDFIGCLNQSCADCFQKVLACASCGCGASCGTVCGCCER